MTGYITVTDRTLPRIYANINLFSDYRKCFMVTQRTICIHNLLAMYLLVIALSLPFIKNCCFNTLP